MVRMVRKDYLPFGRPSFAGDEIAAVSRVLSSGWVGMGPGNHAFESERVSTNCHRRTGSALPIPKHLAIQLAHRAAGLDRSSSMGPFRQHAANPPEDCRNLFQRFAKYGYRFSARLHRHLTRKTSVRDPLADMRCDRDNLVLVLRAKNIARFDPLRTAPSDAPVSSGRKAGIATCDRANVESSRDAADQCQQTEEDARYDTNAVKELMEK